MSGPSDLELFDSLRPTQVATWSEGQELWLGEKAGMAATLLGLALFAVAFAVPGFVSGLGWAGPIAVGGLVVGGVALWMAAAYRQTPPGIRNDGVVFASSKTRSVLTFALTLVVTGFYVVLYWWDQYRPDSLGHLNPLAGGVALVDPIARALSGQPADKWFLYSFLYTAAVGVMGIRMFWRYRHNRYHLIRTCSVIWFQLSFGFVVPQLLKLIHQKDFYFTYFWPLKPEYFLPFETGNIVTSGSMGRFMLLWSIGMSFVAVPVLTWRFGKRWYCSWVCGCGALAETFGDPWRQLSDKSERAWRIERVTIHSVLLLIVGITGFLWVHEAMGRPWLSDGGSQLFWDWYGFFIASMFAGVVGTGFYPVLGARIWCRFGCPQAAILGILQRYMSRFRITTNGGQCISCGNCSTYCEMGIDVRAYAQRGENIVRASCVGCGVCAAVCPRGVLKLENGPVGHRFPGADEPFMEIRRSLGLADRDAPRGGP